MPLYADTATIAVHPATPEHKGFAHRLFRDLKDRGYQVYFEPDEKATLTVIASWTDAFGWNIQYHSKARSETFRSLEYFYQSIRSDFILANQSWVPPGAIRPF